MYIYIHIIRYAKLRETCSTLLTYFLSKTFHLVYIGNIFYVLSYSLNQ